MLSSSGRWEKRLEEAPPAKGAQRMSQSISRVLSWTIIHLRRTSPSACSNLPESAGDHG